MNTLDHQPGPESQSLHQVLYRHLMGKARGGLNEVFITQMLASWIAGRGALPHQMGLEDAVFVKMLNWHFPSFAPPHDISRNAIPPNRNDELTDVRKLLLDHRQNRSLSELWVAEIIAGACLASDHLWSDLGLFSRTHLTQMMELNFPTLATRNDKNMKWKKFLYKQLCEMEGLNLCRAPSCEACMDFADCFLDGDNL